LLRRAFFFPRICASLFFSPVVLFFPFPPLPLLSRMEEVFPFSFFVKVPCDVRIPSLFGCCVGVKCLVASPLPHPIRFGASFFPLFLPGFGCSSLVVLSLFPHRGLFFSPPRLSLHAALISDPRHLFHPFFLCF